MPNGLVVIIPGFAGRRIGGDLIIPVQHPNLRIEVRIDYWDPNPSDVYSAGRYVALDLVCELLTRSCINENDVVAVGIFYVSSVGSSTQIIVAQIDENREVLEWAIAAYLVMVDRDGLGESIAALSQRRAGNQDEEY